MLLSLTEALAQDIRYLQSGVQILALMPNINQKILLRNKDWIRGIGLQNLTLDLSLNQGGSNLLLDDIEGDLLLGQQDNTSRRDILRDDLLLDDDLLRGNLLRNQRRQGQRMLMDDDLRRERLNRLQNQGLLLNNDLRRNQILEQGLDSLMVQDDLHLQQGQRSDGLSLDGRRMIDILARNMIRAIELGQNGMLLLIGLQGSKNLQKEMQSSRL